MCVGTVGDAGEGKKADRNSVGDTALLYRGHLVEHTSTCPATGKGRAFGDGAGGGEQSREMLRC